MHYVRFREGGLRSTQGADDRRSTGRSQEVVARITTRTSKFEQELPWGATFPDRDAAVVLAGSGNTYGRFHDVMLPAMNPENRSAATHTASTSASDMAARHGGRPASCLRRPGRAGPTSVACGRAPISRWRRNARRAQGLRAAKEPAGPERGTEVLGLFRLLVVPDDAGGVGRSLGELASP